MTITFNESDRIILDRLGEALYEANSDSFHASQDRTFGHIADAIFETVENIAKREEDVGERMAAYLGLTNVIGGERQAMLLLMQRVQDDFYANWHGARTASLLEEILRDALKFGITDDA